MYDSQHPDPPPGYAGELAITPPDKTATVQAQLLDQPAPDGNVEISWSFGAGNSRIAVGIDSYVNPIQPTLYTGSQHIFLSPGHHTIYAIACYYKNVIDTATIDVPQPTPKKDYTVVIHDVTPSSGGPAVQKIVHAGDTATADIKLGTSFSVEVRDSEGVRQGISLSTPTSKLEPALTWKGSKLWTDRNLLSVGSDFESNPSFAAVHLGEANTDLSLTGESKPIHLKVRIVDATGLGTAENGWDERLSEAGNQRGIPPYLLKAQAARESHTNAKTITFNRYTFRYEPCTAGLPVHDSGALSSTPYSNYLFDTAKTDGTFDTDFLQRTWKTLYRPVKDTSGQIIDRTHLTVGDSDVLAGDIVKVMNKWPPGGKHGMNWIVYPSACLAYRDWYDQRILHGQSGSIDEWADAELNFQAQPAVASSYGLFQVLYRTAITEDWSATLAGGQSSQDPKYLFDSDENLKLPRGGSVGVGSAWDAWSYLEVIGAGGTLGSPELFTHSFNAMFKKYNGNAKTSIEYANTIEQFWAPKFLPSTAIRFE